MPFTTSHPAIILPLKKLWPQYFSLSGLMAGAMSPDLQYFLLADTTHRGLSHSWLGLFTICLPMGLLFCFAFHWLFKRPFIASLPRPVNRVLSGLAQTEFRPSGYRAWLVLLISVLVGALSHFFWDSFTHVEGVTARHIPWLLEKNTLFGLTRDNTRWLQHLSTLVGAAVVVFGTWKLKLLPSPVEGRQEWSIGRKLTFWLLGTVCGIALGAAAVWHYNGLYDWRLGMGENRGLAFMSFGTGSWAGFFWFTCVYSLVTKRQRVKQPGGPPVPGGN
jgi:membrane-bound metal-dependent hydrolase YbcI (DUF457 family)